MGTIHNVKRHETKMKGHYFRTKKLKFFQQKKFQSQVTMKLTYI